MFAGYFQLPDASAEALDAGWLHTGDAGYLEPDGHLVVLGRLSEVVHTAKGERYIPNYIENRLKFSQYVKDVAVLGKDRDDARRDRLHRQGAGRPLGRGARHLVACRTPTCSQRPGGARAGRLRSPRVNATLPEA